MVPLPSEAWSRREFLTLAAAAASPAAKAAPGSAAGARLIGIQIGPASFQAEGAEAVLEWLTEKAAVNALFIETYSHGAPSAKAMAHRVAADHGAGAQRPGAGGVLFCRQYSEMRRKNLAAGGDAVRAARS